MAGAKLFIVIVGCGRLGSYLASKMSAGGHSVVVLDINEQSFQRLSAEYSGFRVEGDATELAVLKHARADRADVVIAATREDNVNLMVVQICKTVFNVPRVVARLFDPRREEIYRSLGIETICPTAIAGDLLLTSLIEWAGVGDTGG